jgi:nucleotide-binding universal stress UspA family protein
MRFLICSDGKPAADNAIKVGGPLAAACHAKTTLLGIAEEPADEKPLSQALETQAKSLRDDGVSPNIVIETGEPIGQILDQTSKVVYDLVVIGARWTGTSGHYWRSQTTYELIKAIPPPVLVAMGERREFKRFLLCTGGKEFIEGAVQLTGKIAAGAGASVTLLHVMAEPPALYADLIRLEEDADLLLKSHSELGRNLTQQRKDLEALGVTTEVRVRHGIVIDQVLAEARDGKYDIIVTGSSQARGPWRHFIMGDLTRMILNHAESPVLVARAGKGPATRSFLNRIKLLFTPRKK